MTLTSSYVYLLFILFSSYIYIIFHRIFIVILLFIPIHASSHAYLNIYLVLSNTILTNIHLLFILHLTYIHHMFMSCLLEFKEAERSEAIESGTFKPKSKCVLGMPLQLCFQLHLSFLSNFFFLCHSLDSCAICATKHV